MYPTSCSRPSPSAWAASPATASQEGAETLANPIWVGKLVNSQGEYDVMEPLIDPEPWHAVQRGLCKDGKRRGRHSEHFLLAGGLLRCGCCGSAMAVRRADTPAGMREHYRCMGRRSGAAECKQPDVPRLAIDASVMEYFTAVALDVEGTVAQLTGERDRRLAELDERLVAAREREHEVDAELARCDAALREGMALEQWQRVVAPAEANKEQAQADVDSLLAECEQVEATRDVADAAGEFVERITALRSAVAGDITQPSQSGRRRSRSAGCSTGSSCTPLTRPQLRAGWTPSSPSG